MDGLAHNLGMIGGLLFLGLLADELGRRTPLPRVTLLLALGVVAGPWLVAPAPGMGHEHWFPAIAHIALVMVGFLLGGELTAARLRVFGRGVMSIALSTVGTTALFVAGGLMLVGTSPETALVLAGIATATAPAATADVVHELRARGPFTTTLLGVVAIDDAIGLIIFSLLLVGAEALVGAGLGFDALAHAAWDVAGSVGLGVALGVPAAYLTGRVRRGEPTLVEALGLVFLCAGLGLALHVSTLLAAMVLGATIANLARHHTRPFRAIERIEWPFMVLFFVFAGASFEPGALAEIGWLVAAYVILRLAGRLVGAWLGARGDPHLQRWIGLALTPQAGVALGMALIVRERHPEFGARVMAVAVAATVFFELFGPVLTRYALRRSGEANGEANGENPA